MLISSDSLKTLLGGNKRNNNRPIKNKKSEAITEALIQKIINDELGEQGSIQLYVTITYFMYNFILTYCFHIIGIKALIVHYYQKQLIIIKVQVNYFHKQH